MKAQHWTEILPLQLLAWCHQNHQALQRRLPTPTDIIPQSINVEVRGGQDLQTVLTVLARFSTLARARMPELVFEPVPVPDWPLPIGVEQILLQFDIARSATRQLVLIEGQNDRVIRIVGHDHSAKAWINRVARLAAHSKHVSPWTSLELAKNPQLDFDTTPQVVAELLADVGAASTLGFSLNPSVGLNPFVHDEELRTAVQDYLHARYMLDQAGD